MNEKFDLTLHYRGGEADTGEMDYERDLCVTQGTKDGKPVIEYKIVKVKDHLRNKKARQSSFNVVLI